MPTREQQLVQLEAGLRQRFFPLVPKITSSQRQTWTEDQHDIDRLTRALAAYVLVGLCELDDTTAVGAITDGSDDGGLDALYFDRSRNRLIIVQSKFKKSGTAPSQEEILKTINGIRALLDRRFDHFNATIRGRLDEIEDALDSVGVQVYVVLAFLGEIVGPHVTNDLNALKADLNRLNPRMDWQPAGLGVIHGWLLAEQMPEDVSIEVVLENWACVTAPRKAVYGQISAAALAELVVEKGKALFERNIRHYLGSIGVNTAIEETVRRRPGDFFYLNNGITAVTEVLTQAAGNTMRCVFGLTRASIVNGAQTAGAIANALIQGTISPDAKVLITIVEIGGAGDDIGVRITRARNHQNVVRGVDFAALDPNQERLRQEMAAAGITYYYRPSAEARTRRDDAFTLEEAAVALSCLSMPIRTSIEVRAARTLGQPVQNAIEFVVTAKKEVGRLWEQEGSLYGELFHPTLTGLRICRLVRVFRFIDQILAASERSENSYFRRMFFRHGRHFLMAFVAHVSPDVLDKAELTLSDADKTLLSRRTNEVSEAIYAESTPMQAFKGYLAIFRNLADSQLLAEGVLRRLATPAPAQASPAALGINDGSTPNMGSPNRESQSTPSSL